VEHGEGLPVAEKDGTQSWLQKVEYVSFYMEGWHGVDYGGAWRGCRGVEVG
jgi:hypothetical protein